MGITAREILTYSKIRMAKFNPPILTSQLEGLVQDDDGHIMGLLLSYINCDGATPVDYLEEARLWLPMNEYFLRYSWQCS